MKTINSITANVINTLFNKLCHKDFNLQQPRIITGSAKQYRKRVGEEKREDIAVNICYKFWRIVKKSSAVKIHVGFIISRIKQKSSQVGLLQGEYFEMEAI